MLYLSHPTKITWYWEIKRFKDITFGGIGSLFTHEMKMKRIEELDDSSKRKKGAILKATENDSDDDHSTNDGWTQCRRDGHDYEKIQKSI